MCLNVGKHPTPTLGHFFFFLKDSIASTLYCNNQVIPIAFSSLGVQVAPTPKSLIQNFVNNPTKLQSSYSMGLHILHGF
jgi:hypothetical protein